jgi:hypothetical protein
MVHCGYHSFGSLLGLCHCSIVWNIEGKYKYKITTAHAAKTTNKYYLL